MHLFAYGTLMVPEIWQRVVGRGDVGAAGVLPGYCVRCIRGDLYPVMLRSEQSPEAARGVVYFDIGVRDWAKLDAYESSIYERIEVDVHLDDHRRVVCQSYVVPDSHAHVAGDVRWTADWFQRWALEEYLKRFA